jgi:N-acetylglucosamine-6-sulfatase
VTALRYNIVLVLTDDQPPGSLNRMPYLSSKPHGNWLTMSNAFLHMPQCAPSRASIFTGLYEERHGVKSNTLAGAVLNAGLNETLMLAPTLARAGYHNGLFGKYENK